MRVRKQVMALCLALMVIAPVHSVMAAEPVVIEHLLMSAWGNQAKLATEQIISLFESENPGIKIQLNWATGDYTALVTTRFAGGSAPDVMTSNRLGDLAIKDMLLPLDEMAQKSGILKKLLPPAVALGKWGNQLVMIPQVIQPVTTFYNEQLLAESGLVDPNEMARKNVWNWDSLATSASKIARDTDGNGALDVWGAGSYVTNMPRGVIWLHLAGGYFLDSVSRPTASRFNTEAVSTALEYIRKLMDEKRAMPASAVTSNAANVNFPKNTVGYIFEVPGTVDNLRASKFYSWDIAPLPCGPVNCDSPMHVDGLQISRTTKNPEAAFKWISFLASDPRAVAIFTQLSGRPPVLLSALPKFVDTIVLDGKPRNAQVMIDSLSKSKGTPLIPIMGNFNALNAFYMKETAAFFNGQQSLAATIDNIHNGFNNLLKQ